MFVGKDDVGVFVGCGVFVGYFGVVDVVIDFYVVCVGFDMVKLVMVDLEFVFFEDFVFESDYGKVEEGIVGEGDEVVVILELEVGVFKVGKEEVVVLSDWNNVFVNGDLFGWMSVEVFVGVENGVV